MKILNKTQNTILASKAAVAKFFYQRMKGLLGRRSLSRGEALIIPRCQCIHMFFMRFGIDVLFIDKYENVVGLVEKIKPFQISPFFRKASYAIEGAEGMIKESQTQQGDQIKILEP